MHTVELYRKVRLACRDGDERAGGGASFRISRESVKKMLCFSVPPRNLSTILRHRRFLFTDSFLLLWKWRVG